MLNWHNEEVDGFDGVEVFDRARARITLRSMLVDPL
jgi:hypothetical protein